MVCITFRCSLRMQRAVDALAAAQGGTTTRQQILQSIIHSFLLAPQVYDPYQVKFLREPVTETLSVTLSDGMDTALQGLAEQYHLTLSALVRNALYRELSKEGLL